MMHRRKSCSTQIGAVTVGGTAPVRVQSMTNTDTANIASTVAQIKELADAGSEIVRITVNNAESAAAVPTIKQQLLDAGYTTPIVGDFHYNGHTLLQEHPDCATALDKYRINPGNVGFGDKKDNQFAAIVQQAITHNKPIRIGVNWGSLDQALLTELMNQNAESNQPMTAEDVMCEALVQSCLRSADYAVKLGMPAKDITLSAKVSQVQKLIQVYQMLANRCEYPLHLGLTEAGMGTKGTVASSAALAVLLQQGIGDTIRVSLTPKPNESRTQEVIVAQEILQTMGFRAFTPQVTACPGCGRTTSTFFQELAETTEKFLRKHMPIWGQQYDGVAEMNVAVMGCIVNGPGESKHANIGISLPGTGESPAAPIFIDGKKTTTLRGDNIAEEFTQMIAEYVKTTYNKRA